MWHNKEQIVTNGEALTSTWACQIDAVPPFCSEELARLILSNELEGIEASVKVLHSREIYRQLSVIHLLLKVSLFIPSVGAVT